MTDSRLNWIRWVAVFPCALLATVIVQIGSEAVFRYVLVVSVGVETWTTWVATGSASVLMGAIFVWIVWAVAPRAKVLVSSLALAAVVVWAASLILRSFQDNNPDWLLGMGFCGVAGGLLAFVWARCNQALQAP